MIHLEQTVDGYSGFLFLDDAGLPLVAMHWEHQLSHMVNRYNRFIRDYSATTVNISEKPVVSSISITDSLTL